MTRLRGPDLYYCEPVYRPPSEAYSLLIQATIGCTFHCTFCISNISKEFSIRPLEDIKRDIKTAREYYGPRVDKIFFLDGNAMTMPADQLEDITRYAYAQFSSLQRVGVYTHAEDVLAKTPAQLKSLAEAGLGIAYLGIETGDNDLLKAIGKRTTADRIAQAGKRLMEAGITLSGTFILGLAGNDLEKSRQHAIHSAELINQLNPPTSQTWYISCLTLMIPPGTVVHKQREQGRFKPMTSMEILRELQTLIEHTSEDLHDCVFRSNHASNYLPIKGTLAADKPSILRLISAAVDNPEILRPEAWRGL
jgi:radical SAM superfamily enzyme YgiQ (UPF0313 family)